MIGEIIKASEVLPLMGVRPRAPPPPLPEQRPVDPNAPTSTLAISVWPLQGGIATGEGSYTQGTTVTVTAIPNTNYVFTNWTYANGMIASSEAVYFFTLTGNTTLTANFAFAPPQYPPGVPNNVYRAMVLHLNAANTSRNIVNEYIPPLEGEPLESD